MTATAASPAAIETPGYFAGPEGALFGIVTPPAGRPLDTAVVVASGGWFGTGMGRNQLIVRMCRRAAAHGYHAMRFDYHGVGESGGEISQFQADEWFHDDVAVACHAMAESGPSSFVLVGWCFGAAGVLGALDAAPDLRGVVLVSPPMRRPGTIRWGAIDEAMGLNLWRVARRGIRTGLFAELLRRPDYRRLVWKQVRRRTKAATIRRRIGGRRDADAWVSPGFLAPLEWLVERRVPVLLVYGRGDAEYWHLRRALPGRVGRLLERGKDTIRIAILEGEVSSAGTLAMQSATLDVIDEWLGDLAAGPSGHDEGQWRTR